MKNDKVYSYMIMPSLVGVLILITNRTHLVSVLWNTKLNQMKIVNAKKDPNHPVLVNTEKQLQEYFDSKRKKFNLKLDFSGTEFQKKVWSALTTIAFSETQSYADIARKIDNPKAVRAVGQVIGNNPIAIIVPCHRVIGKNKTLTGFSGGIHNKKKLLDLEQPRNTTESLAS